MSELEDYRKKHREAYEARQRELEAQKRKQEEEESYEFAKKLQNQFDEEFEQSRGSKKEYAEIYPSNSLEEMDDLKFVKQQSVKKNYVRDYEWMENIGVDEILPNDGRSRIRPPDASYKEQLIGETSNRDYTAEFPISESKPSIERSPTICSCEASEIDFVINGDNDEQIARQLQEMEYSRVAYKKVSDEKKSVCVSIDTENGKGMKEISKQSLEAEIIIDDDENGKNINNIFSSSNVSTDERTVNIATDSPTTYDADEAMLQAAIAQSLVDM